MIYAISFSFIATFVATILGSAISLAFKKINKEILSILSNVSLGAIIALLFLELIPESIECFSFISNSFLSVLIPILIILGFGILFYILHELTHHLSHHHDEDHDDSSSCIDHAHSHEFLNSDHSKFVTSLIFLSAIFVHNIPEGLSLGISFISTNGNSFPVNGAIMSGILFIHNLVIGFSLMNSFLSSNKSNKTSFLLTLLSAIPSFVLAIIGYFVSSVAFNELFEGILFALSSGSLLYVLFIELIPQAFYQFKSKYNFIYLLIGISVFSFLIFVF
ncbi:MAG: ZIP family metal transporter [Bacilli bacterium]